MLPTRRLNNLLNHARAYQRSSCLYHDPRAPFSLYEDHECSRARFPTLTTYVLMEHEDEVWNIAWSRGGRYLASASKDRTAVIWKIGVSFYPFHTIIQTTYHFLHVLETVGKLNGPLILPLWFYFAAGNGTRTGL